ncbi:MAG: 4-hydroxythreonine-4-phosphate dehydrogenase PdxA [Pseudomonadales bacterium]|nr:4-hydroxythreonine-4-phosphate dehydrogenase PdxA [Pseudomonadales bacterium]
MKRLSKSKSEITLGITPGEPAGIGPDICLTSFRSTPDTRLVYFADPGLMADRARLLGLDCEINNLDQRQYQSGTVNVHPVKLKASVAAGECSTENASYVLSCLEAAVSACERGDIDAMVTGPIQKSVINDAGMPFSGHTEWLAERTGTKQVVMMLASGNLRVALATTHLPLSEVSSAITAQSLTNTVRILHRDLVDKFAIAQPNILVCGLNPHAGEDGHLGREEIDVIRPVLEALRAEGMSLTGPVPADTAFNPARLKDVDAVLAMYHDQGLPVLKYASFGEAINITLGLPIIRTSVDHGTALDLAGSGKADDSSLLQAINVAATLANARLGSNR